MAASTYFLSHEVHLASSADIVTKAPNGLLPYGFSAVDY